MLSCKHMLWGALKCKWPEIIAWHPRITGHVRSQCIASLMFDVQVPSNRNLETLHPKKHMRILAEWWRWQALKWYSLLRVSKVRRWVTNVFYNNAFINSFDIVYHGLHSIPNKKKVFFCISTGLREKLWGWDCSTERNWAGDCLLEEISHGARSSGEAGWASQAGEHKNTRNPKP